MTRELARAEIPLQSITERIPGSDLTVSVPIAKQILSLDPEVMIDPDLLVGAEETVPEWCDQDMEAYRASLLHWGDPIELLDGYETFPANWGFEVTPQESGLPAISLHTEIGDASIALCGIPVTFAIIRNSGFEFHTPEMLAEMHAAPVVTHSRYDSDVVFIPPEELSAYGEQIFNNTDIYREEVTGMAYCADYQRSVPRVIALRNYAIFYLNAVVRTHLA